MERRTDPCIAHLPLLNAQGSHLFYNLEETRRTCVRDTWTELPLPLDILKRVNKLAAGQRKKLRTAVDEHNNFLEHIDDNELFVNDPADTTTDSSSESDDSVEEDGNNNNTTKLTEDPSALQH
jgi:hypothetical protein